MRTAIYCRVSSPGQKNTTSLPEQERINREKVASLGWQVSEPHVYREVEGGEDLYRPQMDKLWDAIQAHEIDAVVIDVLDRLSRDEGDQGAVYHHADRHGVVIELASQDYDESEQGRMMRYIAGLHARMEHMDIRRRTQRGRRARVASGKLLAGAYPLYGYLWGDPAKGQRTYYIVDPETGWVVVFIFESVANGMPIRHLVRVLEERGIPTPSQLLASHGQLPKGHVASPIWRRTTLQRMLWHPAYWGEHAAYRWQHSVTKVRPPETGVTRKVRQTVVRPEDDPMRVVLPQAACPALVSRELAERVHVRLRANKAESAGRNPDPQATLWRSRAYCGHCGSKMYTATAGDGYGRRYYCRSRTNGPDGAAVPCPGGVVSMAARVLDPAGWADVLRWLSDEENVWRLLADWQADNENAERSYSSRLDAAAAMLANLRAKMDALAETIADTTKGESRRTLQEKLDAYVDQVAAEEKKRERLQSEAHDAAERAKSAEDIRNWVRDIAGRAPTFTPAERQAMLRALGATVQVWRADYLHAEDWPQRYKITLHWNEMTGQSVVLSAYRDSKNL
jgi:DNA invertase Pin-like site-specific DNA recombinase